MKKPPTDPSYPSGSPAPAPKPSVIPITDHKGWPAQLLRSGIDGDGPPLPCLDNAVTALTQSPDWAGCLAYNQSAHTINLLKPPSPSLAVTELWPSPASHTYPTYWTDIDDTRAACWLQRHGINVGHEVAARAVQMVARRNSYHPIRDYLTSLTWDGVDRIPHWLTTYFGTDRNPYTEAIGQRWLIGAVARVMAPGPNCKMDTCLVLEGRQGTFKSTALRILAHPWYTDHLSDMGSRHSFQELRGVWIVELGEMKQFEKVSTNARIKSFLSQSVDHYIPQYGRHPVDVARECVFVGTTNHEVYLFDETGARRFWPVKTGWIDIDRLRADRDQLWAETYQYWNSGAPWHLETAYLDNLAATEQSQRFDGDPWEERVSAFLRGKSQTGVTSNEVLQNLGLTSLTDLSHVNKIRVAKILQRLGWERRKVRLGATLFEWKYFS